MNTPATTNASPTPAPSDPTRTFQALEAYPWDTDVEFQSGLSAILGSNSTPEQAAELTLRARCFYYSRKFSTPIDFDAYKTYRHTLAQTPSHQATSQLPSTATATRRSSSQIRSSGSEASEQVATPPSTNGEPPAPYPTTFAHIVELVTTGQPIPGIKDIPDTVLDGQGSVPVRGKRRKPWEKEQNVDGNGNGERGLENAAQ